MVAELSKEYNKTLIIDAMSSFGGIDIDVQKLEIDYLISSANKCIQGVPGFGFVIAKLDKLVECEGIARSLSLDLFDQWKEMDKDGKWRFTSPTHVVAAFSKAIDELIEEGGISARFSRYQNNNRLLRKRLKEVGIHAYITEDNQSPIITTFLFPSEQFSFENFYYFIKEKGYVIYPGKLTDADTFRVGNIGEIYEEDIQSLCNIIEEYMGVVTK
jgi:2-aminoethylphosphonate-pyruvate transaminase